MAQQMHHRTYDEALVALNGLINRRPDVDPSTGAINWAAHFESTFYHLKVLELEEPLSRLSVIHVAGTKGKGSTCAFTESMLRASGFRTGLFTSPHLFHVRERFRFDGVEVSEDFFTEHFWWCWDRLQVNAAAGGEMPGFFRFLTLMALRMFTANHVDVAILEVGLGGRLDATNIVRSPVVCGITSLGYDHMELLGDTLAEIAGEKAGIFKAGVPAITSPQPAEAMAALQKRAKELAISLETAPSLDTYGLEELQLGLGGEHQRINAAVAVALCMRWAQRSGQSEHAHQLQQAVEQGRLPEAYLRGLRTTRWPGRGDIIHDQSGHLSFYLDGAHSPESMEACANWFCATLKAEDDTWKHKSNGCHNLQSSSTSLDGNKWSGKDSLVRRVLLFNCMPKRDPLSLLPPVINTCVRKGMPLHMAFFVPPHSSYTSMDGPAPGTSPHSDVSWQQVMQRHWESLRQSRLSVWSGGVALSHERKELCSELLSGLKDEPEGIFQQEMLGPSSAVLRSLPAALDWFRSCSTQHPQLRIQVLVTGSLYLVGDLLKLLKR